MVKVRHVRRLMAGKAAGPIVGSLRVSYLGDDPLRCGKELHVWRRDLATIDELHRCARVGRVERVMRPYLEATVA